MHVSSSDWHVIRPDLKMNFPYSVCVQAFEQVNNRLEVVDSFLPCRVASVAIRIKGAARILLSNVPWKVSTNGGYKINLPDTCAVRIPLMLPKALRGARVALHITLQVSQKIGLAKVVQERGDARVLPRGVTVFIIGSIAIIWPEAMDCPRV